MLGLPSRLITLARRTKTTGTRSTALAGPRFLVTVTLSCFRPVPNIGFGSDDNSYIDEGGLILCEKPSADVRRDKATLEARSKQLMNGTQWTQAAGSNPFAQTMPRFDESKTEFGHKAEFKE
jgi:hypothetical protein